MNIPELFKSLSDRLQTTATVYSQPCNSDPPQ